jgi:hypothetical protein
MDEQQEQESWLLCNICRKPLVDEEWIDDEEYGDVHTRCLDRVA